MTLFKQAFLFTLMLLLLAGCRQKKVSMTGDGPVKVNDFIDFFQPLSLPLQLDDAALLKKNSDSLLIGYKVFTRFIPDTVFGPVFGKGVQPKIFAIGKTREPDKDFYLFVQMAASEKRALFVLCFDADKKFTAGMPLLIPDKNPQTTQISGIDRRYSLFKTVQKKNADGSISEGKDVYMLDAENKNFILILTDPLEEIKPPLINPIDTLPRKHKFSADYVLNKNNLVSIRDGRKPGRLMFFIHFEKNNGECSGELKGEAILKTATTAEYHATGNLCALQFRFTSSSVTISEISPCGSYRGLRCLFEGTYPKKKIPAKKK